MTKKPRTRSFVKVASDPEPHLTPMLQLDPERNEDTVRIGTDDCIKIVRLPRTALEDPYHVHRKEGRLVDRRRAHWPRDLQQNGRTIFYREHIFRRIVGGGFKSNYYEATGEDYWISGRNAAAETGCMAQRFPCRLMKTFAVNIGETFVVNRDGSTMMWPDPNNTYANRSNYSSQ